jgi:glycosyltransferase involved in cell wall biosynthesis
VVHNAVDLEHFQPRGTKADLDSLAGLEPAAAGTVRIGLVATYARWKGQEVFLQAASHYRDPRVRCFVIGGPIYQTGGSQFSKEELVSLASRLGVLGRVGFIDFQPDTAPIYRALDVVVHASTQPEPFGLTIAEAMACGRAVVVAKAGGAQELFNDELDALGVPPSDSLALATRLQQLVERPDLRQRLGEAARTSAESKFALRAFATRLLSVYSSLVHNNRERQARADSLVKIAQNTLTSGSHPVK